MKRSPSERQTQTHGNLIYFGNLTCLSQYLLIKKGICDCQNISSFRVFVFVCVFHPEISSFLGKSFSYLFLFIIKSISGTINNSWQAQCSNHVLVNCFALQDLREGHCILLPDFSTHNLLSTLPYSNAVIFLLFINSELTSMLSPLLTHGLYPRQSPKCKTCPTYTCKLLSFNHIINLTYPTQTHATSTQCNAFFVQKLE